jgi:hypothetical protein
MTAFLISLFNALAAIPKIAGYVDSFAGAVVLWWIQRQKKESMAAIADAAALAARANTPEEMYAATDAWHRALSLPRVTQ